MFFYLYKEKVELEFYRDSKKVPAKENVFKIDGVGPVDNRPSTD